MSDQMTIYTYTEFGIAYNVYIHGTFVLRIEISKSYNNYDKYIIPFEFDSVSNN